MHEGIRKLKLGKYPVICLDERARALEPFKEFGESRVKPCDAFIAVVLNLEEMKELLQKVSKENLLNEQGRLIILYPKKGNKVYETYIHRDSIFEFLPVDDDGYIEETTLKFNSMTAFDEVFTALGVKNTPVKTRRKGPSQCVEDYVNRVEELRSLLDEKTLALYNDLTPGYQVGWARHVFSTKTEATRQKRLQQMKEILGAGFKSIDFWRKEKK